jgi:hypothetical protein
MEAWHAIVEGIAYSCGGMAWYSERCGVMQLSDGLCPLGMKGDGGVGLGMPILVDDVSS